MENESVRYNGDNNSTNHFSDGKSGREINLKGIDASKEYISVDLPLKMSVVGQLLKGFRKIRNLSQEKLGELVGVRKSQISKIEKGDRNLTLGTVIKLFKAIRAKVSLRVELESKKELALIKQATGNTDDSKLPSE